MDNSKIVESDGVIEGLSVLDNRIGRIDDG